jgi:hypothetical protein
VNKPTWETCPLPCSKRCRARIGKDKAKIEQYEAFANELRALFGKNDMALDELVSRIETECYYASLG